MGTHLCRMWHGDTPVQEVAWGYGYAGDGMEMHLCRTWHGDMSVQETAPGHICAGSSQPSVSATVESTAGSSKEVGGVTLMKERRSSDARGLQAKAQCTPTHTGAESLACVAGL